MLYHGNELGTTSVPPTIRFLPTGLTGLTFSGFKLTVSGHQVLEDPQHLTLLSDWSRKLYKTDRGR